MHLILLAVTLATAPFPLPGVEGKAPAVTEGQKHFRLPMRFEKVREFYTAQFAQTGVQVVPGLKDGARSLTLVSKRPGDAWRKAVVHEGTMETTIDVTPVIALGEEEIRGQRPTPLVQFVFTRSPEVQRSLESIDHTEALREK